MSKNIIKNLIEHLNNTSTDKMSIDKISFLINQLQGCRDSTSRNILYTWIKGNTKATRNKRLNAIVCFCLFFDLSLERIEEVLDFLKIDYDQRKDILRDISHRKNNEVFTFYGYDSLQITNFVKELKNNNLNTNINIAITYITGEISYIQNVNLQYNLDNYIRDIVVNDTLLGGDNATQGKAIKTIQFTLEKDKIEKILTEPSLSFLTLYTDINISIPIDYLFKVHKIDDILVYIKNGKINYCPNKLLEALLNKNISISMEEKIYESFRVVNEYFQKNKCTKDNIYTMILFLENKIFNIQTLKGEVYIIEVLSYLGVDNISKKMIWDIAYRYYIRNNNDLKHIHTIWSFVTTLDAIKIVEYSVKNRKVVLRLEEIILKNCTKEQEFPILEAKLDSLKNFFKL